MQGILKWFKDYSEANKAKVESPRFKLVVIFLIHLAFCYLVLLFALSYLSGRFFPTDVEFMTQVKEFDSSSYVGIAIVMIGYLKIKRSMNTPIALAALFSILMAVSSQLLSLVPVDIDIPGEGEPGQAAIFGPVTLMFVSMVGIAINLIWTVFQTVEKQESPQTTNQDPT